MLKLILVGRFLFVASWFTMVLGLIAFNAPIYIFVLFFIVVGLMIVAVIVSEVIKCTKKDD